MIKKIAVVTLACLVSLSYASFLEAQAPSGKTVVKVTGADSMIGRIRVLTKVFMNSHPAIDVEMVGGQLVDVGIHDLIEGKADLAMASRRLTAHEDQEAVKKGAEFVERLVGYGGVVIVVNPANPVTALTVEQVRKILKGEITRWDQVGGKDEFVTVVRQDDSQHPGTFIFMQDDFLGGAFAYKSVVLSTFQSIINKVATTPSAIGYVRVRDVLESPSAKKLALKIVNIKKSPAVAGVAPSRESISDGTYALRRPYYVYYNVKANSDVVKLADFIVGKGWGGQDL
jgi:phosphate transport system substrate-binding protein